VFVGWTRNTAGLQAWFAKDPAGRFHAGGSVPSDPFWTYHASMAATLLRKFPTLKDYLRQEQQK
jgi:hypothetical protein